ncbi:venom carboxylesterase-6 [Daphnia magna]|uniref:venom carboxylesterase-6 n=1 Tax=Daphnia magna TaxID=35525 RepID=UPI001E1BDD25|nr:venom carboxylesterase-6 [Daphnia magna]
MELFIRLYLTLVGLFVFQCHADEQPVVNIPFLGSLRGSVMVSASGRKFNAFRGIPYAQPPVGDLRFNDPIPAKPWTGTLLDATKEGPTCLQFDLVTKVTAGQEDCLVLNVYTTNVDASENPLPVMVWIHGGGFTTGSGNSDTDLYGPGYILDRDVVLVTLNYRLGSFGFLSTEDKEAPGNYGLLDQSLALKWVRDHVHHFGGNTNSITIFGESAGGASVEYQVLSPYSKGLFHRAIAQSGSTRCPWAHTKSIGAYTRILAEDVNCPTTNSKELLKCLRSKDVKEFLDSKKKMGMIAGLGLLPIAFVPRVDAEREFPFLPDTPERLVANKQFNQVPFIGGLTENEGGLFAASLATLDGEGMNEFKTDPVKNVLHILAMENRKGGPQIAQKVYDYYFSSAKTDEDIISQYGELSSDIGFFKCVDDSVKALAQHNAYPVFYYQYAHRGQLSLVEILDIPKDSDFGVAHADEILLMFPNYLMPRLSHPNDLKVSKMLLDLWTSFAADGIPQSDDVVDKWLPTTREQVRYLRIEANNPKLINNSMPFQSKLDFWKNLLTTGKDEL